MQAEQIPFDSINLQVESRLQLLMRRNHERVQYFSTLIGFVRDEYLVVKMPAVEGVPILLHEGEQLIVRVFTGVKVCSFSATVDRVFLHPLFYAHLSFPQKIDAVSLRTAMRVRADFPGSVETLGSERQVEKHEVRVANLSVTGALLESSQPLGTKGEAIALAFSCGWDELRVEAAIRNITTREPAATDRPRAYSYGVEFTELDAAGRLRIENLIYQTLVENRQNLL